MHPSRQSTWILKLESPSPSASSPRRTVKPTRRSRSRRQTPTRRLRFNYPTTTTTTTGPGGRVLRSHPTPPPPLSIPVFVRSIATPPKTRSTSSEKNGRTTATAVLVSVVKSTTAKSSRSNSQGITQYPPVFFFAVLPPLSFSPAPGQINHPPHSALDLF